MVQALAGTFLPFSGQADCGAPSTRAPNRMNNSRVQDRKPRIQLAVPCSFLLRRLQASYSAQQERPCCDIALYIWQKLAAAFCGHLNLRVCGSGIIYQHNLSTTSKVQRAANADKTSTHRSPKVMPDQTVQTAQNAQPVWPSLSWQLCQICKVQSRREKREE